MVNLCAKEASYRAGIQASLVLIGQIVAGYCKLLGIGILLAAVHVGRVMCSYNSSARQVLLSHFSSLSLYE